VWLSSYEFNRITPMYISVGYKIYMGCDHTWRKLVEAKKYFFIRNRKQGRTCALEILMYNYRLLDNHGTNTKIALCFLFLFFFNIEKSRTYCVHIAVILCTYCDLYCCQIAAIL
jgi:hypothetical protein